MKLFFIPIELNVYRDPLLKDALQRHQSKTPEEKKAQEVADDETLLDHLVKMTSGQYASQILLNQTLTDA